MVVLAAVTLAVMFAFVALSVDTGLIALTQTNLQNAVDAASLAAAQELTVSIQEGEGGGGAGSEAVAAARQMATDVAEANGVYVDPNRDVEFGKRSFDEQSNSWTIIWGVEPYNVVKVTALRNQADLSAPDGSLPMSFGWAVGRESVDLSVSAAAFIEARDIALVLDYSGSMNYDSQFREETLETLGQDAIEDNLEDIWEDLGSPLYGNLEFDTDYATVSKSAGDVKWMGSSVEVTFDQNAEYVYLSYYYGGGQYFDGGSTGETDTYSGSGSYSGDLVKKAWLRVNGNWTEYNFFSNSTMKQALGLDSVTYPYDSGSWDNYLDYCRDSTGASDWYDYQIYATGHRRKFGMLTLVEFWIKHKKRFNQTDELWKTRHYPFHAVKEGATLMCDFLEELDYGDNLGLVTYDTNSRIETGLNDPGMPVINLGSELMTSNYSDIDTIQIHKQAAHYGNTTNIGGGLHDAKSLLTNYGRYGARPTIVLMTDGNANVNDPNWSLPQGWDWSELTDYDGNGEPDYTTTDEDKLYAIGKAKEAVDLGYTIHTMSVGANADRDMMRAIAFIGGGIWLDIPGGTTVSQMEAQVRDAFEEIAAYVPPAKLVYED